MTLQKIIFLIGFWWDITFITNFGISCTEWKLIVCPLTNTFMKSTLERLPFGEFLWKSIDQSFVFDYDLFSFYMFKKLWNLKKGEIIWGFKIIIFQHNCMAPLCACARVRGEDENMKNNDCFKKKFLCTFSSTLKHIK